MRAFSLRKGPHHGHVVSCRYRLLPVEHLRQREDHLGALQRHHGQRDRNVARLQHRRRDPAHLGLGTRDELRLQGDGRRREHLHDQRAGPSNTSNFSSGGGTGTAQKISAWVEIPQVLSINPNGGRARFIDVRTIKALQGIKLPDGFDAASIDFEIAWDTAQSNWATIIGLSRNTTLVAYKSVKGSGAASYAYGYFQMGEQPLQASGQVDRAAATFAALGRTISY